MHATLTHQPTWHEGEIAIQERLGVAERMADVGQRVVRDHMPDQHREFFAQLPFVVLGSVDAQADAWATFIEGEPGFMSSPTPTRLSVGARPDPTDPAGAGMTEGASVGLLGIEMHTRRRNRMNGILSGEPHGFQVQVDQSFGNCPRYITLRDFSFARPPGRPYPGAREDMPALDATARAMIEAADTFFVASYADRADRRQVDVSHRGGKPGFVRVADDGTLTVPDFNGNLFFSTLGNILLNGKAGLVFVDFRTGDMLQLTGDAELVLASPEIAAFQGAERLWTFRARRIVRRRGALALRGVPRAGGASPSSLATGDWRDARDRLDAAGLATQWRALKVTRVVQESATIRSFHLQPHDGAGLPAHQAGQHLPIRVAVPGSEQPLIRTYTLSCAASDSGYRISVKRDGRVSQHLHDAIGVGDTIEARAPAGRFVLDPQATRPAVLLAAGVGITPMLAMLRQIVHEGRRTQRIRPAILFHAARSRHERAFERELTQLAQAAGGAVRYVRVLSDTADAVQGRDYDDPGRIDMELLGRYLPFGDYDFYLCGPPAFTQAIYDGLRSYGIADGRIHAEAFGPSSLARSADGGAPEPPPAPAATRPVPVAFVNSGRTARWTPGSSTLLELAQANGLRPEYGCREGTCGTCRTRVLKGAVTYARRPAADVAQGEALICCAVPARQEDGDEQGLALAL